MQKDNFRSSLNSVPLFLAPIIIYGRWKKGNIPYDIVLTGHLHIPKHPASLQVSVKFSEPKRNFLQTLLFVSTKMVSVLGEIFQVLEAVNFTNMFFFVSDVFFGFRKIRCRPVASP